MSVDYCCFSCEKCQRCDTKCQMNIPDFRNERCSHTGCGIRYISCWRRDAKKKTKIVVYSQHWIDTIFDTENRQIIIPKVCSPQDKKKCKKKGQCLLSLSEEGTTPEMAKERLSTCRQFGLGLTIAEKIKR